MTKDLHAEPESGSAMQLRFYNPGGFKISPLFYRIIWCMTMKVAEFDMLNSHRCF